MGHENIVKHREMCGVYFHLKGRSKSGPTKRSRVLSAVIGRPAYNNIPSRERCWVSQRPRANLLSLSIDVGIVHAFLPHR